MRYAAHALAALGLIAAAGCGSDRVKTAPVRGVVKFNGRPVTTGTVTFVPTAPGPSATGDIQPDGTYRLTTFSAGDGAVLGAHKVVVVAMEDMKDRLPEQRSPLPPPVVPNKYTSLATTDLTAEVKDGDNTVPLELAGDLESRRRK